MAFTQAISKKQIYSFKGNFNAAVSTILTNAGLTASIERSNGTNPTSGCDITFDLGTAANQGVSPQGDLVYDFFEGNKLMVRIYTERPGDSPSVLPGIATLHDEFCGTVLAVMEERLRPFDAIMPYYQVNMIRPLQTQSGFDPRFMIDWTTIVFEVWFGIRPSAWPSS